MPGLASHTYILFKALLEYHSASPLFKRIKESHDQIRRYATQNKPGEYLSDEKCILSSFAYIGCCGPDLFYLEQGSLGKFIADLMHYNKTGLYMIWCLRECKKQADQMVRGFSEDKLRMLSYCLGHISHIAADINVHPFVNTIVQAYPDNPSDFFKNARGVYAGKIWKFHNILEQYQDAYVLNQLFFDHEGFGRRWETVNMAMAAANLYLQKANKNRWFLLNNCKQFYRFKKSYSQDLEQSKYEFFTNKKWYINPGNYYNVTIPNRKMMQACPQLVQGGHFDKDGRLLKPGLFDEYLRNAIDTTKILWKEVDAYLAAPQKDLANVELKPDKKYFPILRRHWNLDTGLAIGSRATTAKKNVTGKEDTNLYRTGDILFQSIHIATKGDM